MDKNLCTLRLHVQFGGFLSLSPGPAGDEIRGAVGDTSSHADMTRAQADSPGAVFEVGLRENRVSQSDGG